jgi:DNA-binding NarL/FixJ family response regulator
VLADDHELVREGLKTLFRKYAKEWTIAGEATNGQEAVDLVAKLQPELVILDLSMPVLNGFQAAERIRKIAPTTKIVMLTMHSAPQAAQQAERAGIDAYVTKSEAGVTLIRTIDSLFAGRNA